MKKNKWGLISAFLLITATVWAANQVFTDKAPSSIKIENSQRGLGVETTEVKYITAYLPDYAKQLLIKVTTTTHFDTGLDGSEGATVIEARSQKDFFATPLWSVQDQGQQVSYVNDQLLRSAHFGCCGDFTRSVLYNAETGKSPATYLDEDFYTITVPNTHHGNRYLAQIEDVNAPKMKNGKNYVGSIAYFDDTQMRQTVRFYVKVPAGWGTQISDVTVVSLAGKKSKNAFRDKTLELWDSDGNKDAKSAFKNFALTAALYFENQKLNLKVPVKDDQVDQTKIDVSPGLEYDVVF